MKGKGKGEREKIDKSEVKECPLQFPEMAPVDHPRLCPRYTAGKCGKINPLYTEFIF